MNLTLFQSGYGILARSGASGQWRGGPCQAGPSKPNQGVKEDPTLMISNETSSHINAQINRELYSAYFYLGLSAQAEAANLKGAAAWFKAKHSEEMNHALKMYHYLLRRPGSRAVDDRQRTGESRQANGTRSCCRCHRRSLMRRTRVKTYRNGQEKTQVLQEVQEG